MEQKPGLRIAGGAVSEGAVETFTISWNYLALGVANWYKQHPKFAMRSPCSLARAVTGSGAL
jgi:hypothetical protein